MQPQSQQATELKIQSTYSLFAHRSKILLVPTLQELGWSVSIHRRQLVRLGHTLTVYGVAYAKSTCGILIRCDKRLYGGDHGCERILQSNWGSRHRERQAGEEVMSWKWHAESISSRSISATHLTYRARATSFLSCSCYRHGSCVSQ